jgi:hypothetical protein
MEGAVMQAYEHRQFSQWMVAFFGVSAVVFAMFGFMGAGLPARLVAFLFVAIAIAFSALVTRVNANGVSWAFTLGAPGGSIPFADIEDVEITKTNFWEGWGIHWTIWHGWLWNVSGYGAVIVRKRGGGRVTLGTDDPQGLYEAIARFRLGA